MSHTTKYQNARVASDALINKKVLRVLGDLEHLEFLLYQKIKNDSLGPTNTNKYGKLLKLIEKFLDELPEYKEE